MPEPLKLQMSAEVVDDIADRFTTVEPSFDADSFVDAVSRELGALELKDRVNLIARELRNHLDDDYPVALTAVVDAASTGLLGFAAWPLCSFVELFGTDHPSESLAAMELLTQRMSCEFAIRPFLEHHLDLTVRQLEAWVGHDAAEVRRLVSEGTRPRLPWGPRVAALTNDPTVGLRLIEGLRHDESEDVRRSVANHLNDVAKEHPDLVVETARRWLADGVSRSLVRHALRSLVKQGHSDALAVLGFTTKPSIEVELFEVVPAAIAIGDSIELRANIASTGESDQLLVVDFVIQHPSASGGMSAKVFKWKTLPLAPEESVVLSKRRRIAQASTRTYHPGWHEVKLQVSGEIVAKSGFDLAT